LRRRIKINRQDSSLAGLDIGHTRLIGSIGRASDNLMLASPKNTLDWRFAQMQSINNNF
jgi:hypothetical protein